MPRLTTEPNFSGHETFCFRHNWLKKGIDALSEDPGIFSREDALISLGVGKNMVRSIRHWCLAAQLIEESEDSSRLKQMRTTPMGDMIFGPDGKDPYLEDPGTLWLLHWLITSNERTSTTWHFAFSHWSQPDFTKESLVKALIQAVRENGFSAQAETSIRRDVDCFVRTYVSAKSSRDASLEDTFDCPLSELELLVESSDSRSFYFNRGDHPDIDELLLASMISLYWHKGSPNKTLTYEQLAYYPGSPGRLLRFDESSLSSRLERMENATGGSISYGETAGLKQLYRKSYVPPEEYLKAYYTRG